MAEGWQLLKIRGIPVRIHPSWFVILAMVTFALERAYRSQLAGYLGGAPVWPVALATAVLLFVSVLLHELGHSLVAMAQGVQVRSITLFLLGGVASVERECATARGALLVAAAGPAVSLALGTLLWQARHGASHLSPVLGQVVLDLAVLNLTLGFFNLLPGLPLDGGLIVKALVWQVSGSQRRGVEVANASGRFLSWMAIGLGSFWLLRGASLGGAWLMLLGWFGLGSARSQQQLLQVQRALRELTVKDVARRRFRVLEGGSTLRELSEMRLRELIVQESSAASGQGAPGAPAGAGRPGGAGVGGGLLSRALGPQALETSLPDWLLVSENGRWRGVIDDRPLQELPVQRWDGERIRDHVRPLDSLPSIRESSPLWQAALRFEENDAPRLLVLSAAGLPSGTLEKPELAEAVLQRLGLRLPPEMLALARRQGGYPLGLNLAQVARGMVAAGEVAP
ncbi:MAG: site-2 protease family protein [Synechococcaceae cyanobacterium]|nr:site-2 protease family protein [Synechococcaceae cyanobacterium]